MDPPLSDKQSLHQHLIVQRSKPLLTYTRVIEYQLTPSKSILSIGLSICTHYTRPRKKSTRRMAPTKHENTTSRNTIARPKSAYEWLSTLLVKSTPYGSESRQRSIRKEQPMFVKHGPSKRQKSR